MILVKRSILSLLSLVVAFVGFTSYANQSSAQEVDLDIVLAEKTSEYITLDQSTGLLKINNEEKFKDFLKKYDVDNLSISKVKEQLDNANQNIMINKYKNVNDDIFSTASMCSNMMSVLGLAHTTSLSVAGSLLGVNPFLVIGIVAAYGIVWTGAGFACK